MEYLVLLLKPIVLQWEIEEIYEEANREEYHPKAIREMAETIAEGVDKIHDWEDLKLHLIHTGTPPAGLKYILQILLDECKVLAN